MYLSDLHTHSILSMDGRAPLREMAQAAVAAGLSELTVTDHCDLLTGEGARSLTYDWAPVLAQFARESAWFQGRLKLCLGIELGSAHVSPEHARAILTGAGEELDLVIGSIHNYRESSGGGDFYFVNYTSPAVCYAALDDYFAGMEELVGLADCYDVLGHIIYPLRYMVDRDGQRVSLKRYRDRIAHILEVVIAKGRGIEVNTYRGRTVEQWRTILTLYRDLGGQIVTTGSDAHIPAHVGKGLAQACELLRACGFARMAVYRRRQAEFITI